jgi:hypothetical protein
MTQTLKTTTRTLCKVRTVDSLVIAISVMTRLPIRAQGRFLGYRSLVRLAVPTQSFDQNFKH